MGVRPPAQMLLPIFDIFLLMGDSVIFIVMGLLFDILGILILAGPLVRLVYKNKEGFDARHQQAIDEYEAEKKLFDSGIKRVAHMLDVTRIEKYIYYNFSNFLMEKEEEKELAIIGLSIITFGFILQIIGNILQSI